MRTRRPAAVIAARATADAAHQARTDAYLDGADDATIAALDAAYSAAWGRYLDARLACCGW